MDRPRILDVGQCGFDHSTIASFLRSGFDADVARAGSSEEALAALRARPYDLVLVNRVNDRDGSSGIELIRRIKSDPELANVRVMLVSNHADAQADAEAAGALPGFGKAELRSPDSHARLARWLAPST